MSSTAITVMMSSYEVSADDLSPGSERSQPPYLLQIMNQFLADQDERPLSFIEDASTEPQEWRKDSYGGDSKPYLAVAVGGYRDMPEDVMEDLQAFFQNLPFRYPEVAALICRVGEQRTTVARPSQYEDLG